MQVSRPYQVLLGGAVLLLAVWFVALRPKPAEKTAAPPPAASAPAAAPGSTTPAKTHLGSAIQKARQANAAESASAQRSADAANSVDGSAPASPGSAVAPAAPGGAGAAHAAPGASPSVAQLKGLRSLPQPIRTAVAKKQTIVLLFWNASSADDQEAHRSVFGINRRGGRVTAMAASINSLARYTAITRAVPVLGSPTVVIIDPKLRARSVTGFFDSETLEEAVLESLSTRR